MPSPGAVLDEMRKIAAQCRDGYPMPIVFDGNTVKLPVLADKIKRWATTLEAERSKGERA